MLGLTHVASTKKSSAELSEAINSTFKWYRNAATCYAYLQDVHKLEDLIAPQDGLQEDGRFRSLLHNIPKSSNSRHVWPLREITPFALTNSGIKITLSILPSHSQENRASADSSTPQELIQRSPS